MVGKQVLGWVQGGVACAISVGGGWGGCGARERARGVRGQAHRAVDVATSPPKRARGRWWRRPRRAGDSARAGARAAGRWNRAGPERAPVAVASTWSRGSTFRWAQGTKALDEGRTGCTARLYLQARAAWPWEAGGGRPLTQRPNEVLRPVGCRSRCSTRHLGYSKQARSLTATGHLGS